MTRFRPGRAPLRRVALTALSALVAVAALTSCAAGAAPAPSLSPDAVVIDVRTPAEHASGHLEDALLLDVTGGDLQAAIPTLDPNAEYLVYCRSGNRAGQAIDLLEDAGFTDLTNLGSLEDAAAATGLPVITGD
jgi:phage shock protein E